MRKPWLVVMLPACLLVADLASAPRDTGSMRVTPNDGDARADALAERATIRRDRFGVPHILAETEEAAAFAHGYATAEDHGARLARAFLRARGQQASIFGADFLDDDIHVQTLRLHDVAAERFGDQPPYMQAILNAYAAGYNRYLAGHRADFPAWAGPVTGVDVLAHSRTVLLLDFTLDPRPWNKPPATAASNMWAIGRGLSQSGRGMLLVNPHLGWEPGDALLHEVHITVPGTINVSGATFVGVPAVTMGFNESLGWAHTVNRFDADDVYELTLNAEHTKYSYDGQWLPLRSRTLSIDVKTAAGVEKRTHTATWSHYGPLIRIDGAKGYAYKSANLDVFNFLTQYNAMAKAKTLRAFTTAMSLQQLPMFNVAYADKDGSIWYLFNGRIPVRPQGFPWEGIVPGNTSRSEWFSVWPVSALPQLLNPKTGYLQNCNDAPWYVNLDQGIDRSAFADVLQTDGTTFRAQLSLRILSGEKQLTLERLMQHKYNSEVVLATRTKAELVKGLRDSGGELAQKGAAVLEAWDDTTDADSRGAVLFSAWWDEYSRGNPAPFRVRWDRADQLRTPGGIADVKRAVEAFDRAATAVTAAFGALDVPWGTVHRVRRGSLDLPVGGSANAFQNLTYRRASDGKNVAVAGDSYVLAVEFTDTPRAFSVLPYSQSSNPKSPYFSNQLKLYVDEQFKPAWFTEADILANLDREYRPVK